MKQIILLIIVCIVFSCGNEKTVQLPEIEHTEINEINDVSAAYLFYDEAQKDSVLLNRKNLISTTNWLANVDKRLTLKQAIPHIKFLQEKNKNAGHKNENAKNYFTCHDINNNNLGFVEFTDVVYKQGNFLQSQSFHKQYICITAFSSDSLNASFTTTVDSTKFNKFHKNDLSKGIKSALIDNDSTIIYLIFDKKLKFQDYISLKDEISKIKTEKIQVDKTEFIY
ncbi:MAG: hypothetical protein ACO3VF_07410 [Tamlana sp.]